jgi:ATP-dependent RNA helicase DeaD
MDKDRCLVRIIEIENPASAIIFCNTKVKVHFVSTVLKRFGYDADELSADLNQSAREKVLSRVREGT